MDVPGVEVRVAIRHVQHAPLVGADAEERIDGQVAKAVAHHLEALDEGCRRTAANACSDDGKEGSQDGKGRRKAHVRPQVVIKTGPEHHEHDEVGERDDVEERQVAPGWRQVQA